MAPPPDWLVYVQLSESYPAVKPWEWFTAPEFWTDKVAMYLQARTEIEQARAPKPQKA